jgi:ribonucleoside-diphosphate reductase alpha chain
MGGKEIFVIKRNDASEPLDFEKINQVLLWATEGINGVSASDIAMNAQIQIYDGITTNEIHKVLIQSSVDLISEKTPNYQIVGGNLLNYYIRKDVFDSDNDNLPHLLDVIKANVDRGIYDKKILNDYTEEEINKFNKVIKHKRDYNFVYAGLQQLIDKYLLKDRNTGEVFETPQFMYMLIAMTLFADEYEGDERVKKVQSYYNDISLFKINLPTPIMCGVRTPNRQYSSCTLIDVGDSLDSIFNSNSAVGYYTAKRAGIGLNFGRIRAIGDTIRGGEVVHTGVIPFLKMFESTTKSCTQNGVRGGGSTTHFPFWHKEIREILVLKNNRGTDDNRVRKMDYSIQFNRLFYRRFIKDEELTLFSPHDAPDLYSAFYSGNNDLFEELYEKYERKTSINKKKVRARDLMNQFVQERIGTGRIYLMNVDHVNSHSSFIDPVYMSNLCQEITLPTTPLTHIDDGDEDTSEIALCVLSAINVGEIKDLSDLEELMDNIVRGLDFVITNQDYPVKAALKMLKRRSIGIGVTNLAYYLAKNGFSYEDEGALALVDELMEHIQYYGIKASVKLAQEFGACEWFDRTKYSQGILPIDTYNKNVDKIVDRKYTLDWEALRADVLKYGMRNSTISAFMPCESSAVATNSTNGMEPLRALVTTKKSKKGLLRQVAPEIHKLKNKYQLAYDMDNNRGIINIQAVIQKWIDQSISSNHYYDVEKYKDGEIPISEIVDDILYSYKMGLKTLYYANTNDGKTDNFTEKKKEENVDLQEEEMYIDDESCAGGACSI